MTDLSNFRVTDNVTDMLAAQYNRVLDATLRGELSNVESLAANRTLTDVDYPLQILTPTAARDVTLPAIAAANHPFYIHNDSTGYELTVKNAGGTMIAVITADRSALIASDGTSWHALKLSEMEGDWLADANTWTFYSRTQAYTNDPAAGSAVVLNVASTADFLVGDAITVSSSAGSESTVVTAIVANTSITAGVLALNHTTTTPLITLLGKFTVAGDKTAQFTKGARLRWKQGGAYKYGVVVTSSYGTSTLVTLAPNSDYSVTNAAITDTAYSYLANPLGWPDWFNYSPIYTWTAGAAPTNGSNAAARFKIEGGTLYIQIYSTWTAGTNVTGCNINIPVTASPAAQAASGSISVAANVNLSRADVSSATARLTCSTVAATYLIMFSIISF